MSYGQVQKISTMHRGKRGRVWYKKQANRRRRQEERQSVEHAPRKQRYYSWTY